MHLKYNHLKSNFEEESIKLSYICYKNNNSYCNIPLKKVKLSLKLKTLVKVISKAKGIFFTTF